MPGIAVRKLMALGIAPLVAAVAAIGPAALPAAAAASSVDPASLVNPVIGTINGGDDFPGVDVPFGMVQWSPDTPSRPFGGGYSDNDSTISGFSLTHVAGPGCGAAGDVPILPTVGAVDARATVGFAHGDQKATAGDYSVTLANGVHTELTATARTGFGRFTFPATSQANLVVKLGGSQNQVDGTSFSVVSDTEVTGSVSTGHFCGASDTYTLYFDLVLDHPFIGSGTDSATDPGYAFLTFDTRTTATVQAKVGLSYVSASNAKANLAAEDTGWDAGAVAGQARAAWNAELGKVAVTGGTDAQQAVFYTALYHALQYPSVMSDSNGQYRGYDGKVHTVDGGHSAEYGTFSGWDIYRTQAQLEALIDPVVASDTAQSMVDDFTQTGQFPKWSLYNGETYVMVGDPADSIIADYYAFGARNFDTATALADMVKEASTANNVRPGLSYLDSPGYLPDDGSYGCCDFYGSVSTLLEYDTADYALASFAKALGDTATYTTYAGRAQDWLNVLNPVSGLMQPRLADGSWRGGFDPTSSTGFVEGDSWQYTGMVPFNLAGLATAMGGTGRFRSYLDTTLGDLRGQNGHADLGNEPSLELPWEYDYAGEPYLTQKTVRQAQDQIWSDGAGGLAGNDDLGTMSAWYVWSALGMYPQTPGTSVLALGSPMFPQATVTLAGGKVLTINGTGAADNAPYVQSLTVDGSAWNNAYAPGDLLSGGGTMTYILGTAPNTSWASSASAAPPSDGTGEPPVSFYTTPGGTGLVVAPGGSGAAMLNATNLSDTTQTAGWKATAPAGITLDPSSGSVTVPPRSTVSRPITVTAGGNEGSFTVPIGATSLTVSVARPGELWPYFANAGIGDEGSANAANFDHVGYSYSAQALNGAGVQPGGILSAGGITYAFPNASTNLVDNAEAAGQTISVLEPAGATTLGILGSSTNAGAGVTGTLGLTYTDGTTGQASIGLSDWTLNGGASQPLSGDTTAVSMPRRVDVNGGTHQIGTYLFGVPVPLASGKTLSRITLPTVTGGAMHVFAVGFDVATADPVRLTNPGAQSDLVGDKADLRLSATGGSLTYSATGLPAGLSVNTGTGEITGTLTAPGTSTTRVTAADAAGHASSASFVWTVQPGPIIGVGGQCVDDPSRSTTPGTQMQIYGCNLSPAQQWTVGSDGTLRVLGMCLTASSGKAVIEACSGAANQIWQSHTDGTLSVQSSGNCLEDPGAGGSATRLTLVACTGEAQQQWQLPGGPGPVWVTNPGTQSSVLGTSVSLQIQAVAVGGGLTYSATGLPAGLSINSGTGLISGKPTSKGKASVTVTVTGAGGSTGHASFTWTVDVAVGAITGVGAQCVDDPSQSTTPGTQVQIYGCNQTPAQKWTVGYDGTLRVLGTCLTASSGKAVIQTCSGAANQGWQPRTDGTLANTGTGNCLVDPGSGGSGTQLTMAACDPSNAGQQWTVP